MRYIPIVKLEEWFHMLECISDKKVTYNSNGCLCDIITDTYQDILKKIVLVENK